MIVDWVLTNAKAYLAGEIIECNIAIEEGKIYKIGKETQMPNADQKTDLHSLLVLPGLIDEHVHLRDEGKAYKEDFSSGTSAAAAGGFTTVLDMPNNDPVTMSAVTLNNRMSLAQGKTIVNIGFYSEFPKNLADIKDIIALGPVGFKLFMGTQIGGLDIADDQALASALGVVGEFKVPLAVHAEDRATLLTNERKLQQAKKAGTADFLRAHTESVEQIAIQHLLKLSQQTDVHLHFCHVTSKEGLDTISEARKADRKVTCEVTPNHLLLSSEDTKRLGPLAIMAPPLRNKTHLETLWKGIEDGTIDSIGSDHAPHTVEEKTASNVWEVKVGVPGLETTLPLMITLVKQKRLSLNQVVTLLAEKPAEIFGLTDRGRLERNKRADLTIVDFNSRYTIDASKFHSKAKFSLYNGWELFGRPVKTIVNGTLVFEDGQIVAKGGSGSILRGRIA